MKQTAGMGANARASLVSNRAEPIDTRVAGRIKKKKIRSRRVQNHTAGLEAQLSRVESAKRSQTRPPTGLDSNCSLDFFFLTVAPRDIV